MTERAAELHRALKDANKSRAQLYVAVYRAAEKRLGAEAAAAMLKEAVYEWGTGMAGGAAGCAPSDFAGLSEAFFNQPDGGAMFQPRIERCDSLGVETHFLACPLKEAWVEMGLADEDIALFCDIASAADYGTLEAAGFGIEIETWQPGREGCCRLKICAGSTG